MNMFVKKGCDFAKPASIKKSHHHDIWAVNETTIDEVLYQDRPLSLQMLWKASQQFLTYRPGPERTMFGLPNSVKHLKLSLLRLRLLPRHKQL